MTTDSPNTLSSTVTYEDQEFTTITEGKATILFPNTNEVFYNPVQQFNRDMSIAAIKTWRDIRNVELTERALKKKKKEQEKPIGEAHFLLQHHKFTILEALAATGLRSVRYSKEIEGIKHIIANDLEQDAVKSIERNMKFNNVPDGLIRSSRSDANTLMYSHAEPKKNFDVIDLDPYGSASPFIDGAMMSIADGGLLCVTCTDMQVLAGANFTEACFVKYGGIPLKSSFCHEMALRLVLNLLMTTAARHRKYIVPLVSCSIDFYVRIFVRVFTGANEAKLTASKLSHVYWCQGCRSYHFQPMGKAQVQPNGNIKYGPIQGPVVNRECDTCGGKFQIGGPIYNGPIHDKSFVQKMIEHVKDAKELYHTQPRMLGMLTVISEEIEAPLYWGLRDLTTTLHCNSISLLDLCSAIYNAGYEASISHASPSSVKTNAPPSVMWDIMRAHIKRVPIKNIRPDTPQEKILSSESSIEVNFKYNKLANPPSRKIKLVRFQENPEKNWGPKSRAGKGNKRLFVTVD
ncbi:N2,N2-dimethylguanosine tRNA methyltransferase [Paraphysoderma sedebokerense]|nr:N2,N2-dimethylguanosine tRNA methyltransferase [Paraphysoderma sedebokerense]